ncbi:histamine H3 receptor-like [Pleurodeles waltl]|uniref:histamine H3 receptor-like n=1 Tax=Pleurodeles waltl TaxID=8319 RepID=UPI003709B76D
MSLINLSTPFEGEVFGTNITHLTSEAQNPPDSVRTFKEVGTAVMIGVTGAGNGLVILSFVVDANLRTQSNYYLLNLAICDFGIGTFSTPLFMKNYIMNGKWILGRHVCKMWLVIDYILCQCSINTIILISFDRFLAVTKPVAYREQQHKLKPAVLKMAAAWIMSFLLYGPLILSWEHIAGYSNIPEGECNPEYYYSHYFRLWSSIIFFFTPFAAILFLNVSIYINIKTRTRAKQKHLVGPIRECNAQRDTTTIFTIPDLEIKKGNNSFSGPGCSKKQPLILTESGAVKHIVHTDFLDGVTVLEMPIEKKLQILHITKHSALLSADIKIAKSLSVLVGAIFVKVERI